MDKRTKIAIVLLALLVLGGGILLALKAKQKQVASQIPVDKTEQLPPASEIESVRDLIDGEYEFQPVDTSDWKTYRNEEMGFEVKIPKEWEAIKKDEHICLGEKGKDYTSEGTSICGVYIDVHEKQFLNLRDFIIGRKEYKIGGIFSTSIDNKEAIVSVGFFGFEAIFFKDNNVWRISSISSSLYYPEVARIYPIILQTFKFIP